MGPGLLESLYHKCLAHEFELNRIACYDESYIPAEYKGIELDTTFRCDFLFENAIVVELKAVNEILPIHIAGQINYTKLLERRKGIIINFNCVNLFKEGQKTYVTELLKLYLKNDLNF